QLAGRRRGPPARPALLSAARRRAGEHRLPERLPGPDRPVHGRPLVRRPLGPQELRPDRAPGGRPTDTVRHLQPLLPGRPRAPPPRPPAAARGGAHGAAVRWDTLPAGVALAFGLHVAVLAILFLIGVIGTTLGSELLGYFLAVALGVLLFVGVVQ